MVLMTMWDLWLRCNWNISPHKLLLLSIPTNSWLSCYGFYLMQSPVMCIPSRHTNLSPCFYLMQSPMICIASRHANLSPCSLWTYCCVCASQKLATCPWSWNISWISACEMFHLWFSLGSQFVGSQFVLRKRFFNECLWNVSCVGWWNLGYAAKWFVVLLIG